jgi:hypothetical protein
MNRFCAPVLAVAILLAGCTHQGAPRPTSSPAPRIDPEILALRAQLKRALAERDAALAQLRALQRRPQTVVTVVQTAAPAVSAPRARAGDASQSQQPHVFRTLTTATMSP